MIFPAHRLTGHLRADGDGDGAPVCMRTPLPDIEITAGIKVVLCFKAALCHKIMPPRHPAAFMKSPYITRRGYSALQQELTYLLRDKRPALTQAATEAAAQGDRSENAEYIYGKKLLRETDRRIRFLQKRLPELTVIDQPPTDLTRIRFGAQIKLECLSTTPVSILLLRLVGADEMDASRNWFSIDTPVGQALLGRQVDDEVSVRRPDGRQDQYVILSIHYDSFY